MCKQRDELRLQLAIERVGDRDFDPSADLAQRQRAERARLLLGHQTDDGDVGTRAREVDRLEPDLLGERGAEGTFGDDAELDEDLAEALAAGRLRAERVAELLAREIAALDEQRAERRDRRVRFGRDDAEIVFGRGVALIAGAGRPGISFSSPLMASPGSSGAGRVTRLVTATQPHCPSSCVTAACDVPLGHLCGEAS